jgi:hypothetical protein
MGSTAGERYAVVSCHVERPLDDDVWSRFAALQRRAPGGFTIAALIRPADAAAGEDVGLWMERVQEAAERGPVGHHTHWTAPDHARPTLDRELVTNRHEDPGERVLAEGRRLRELGVAPTLFCGGGWYTDVGVAEACADLGYVDCTPRASRPPYLAAGERWASLAAPARLRLPSGRLLDALPTTHWLVDLARAIGRTLPRFVHMYFHDTDLVSRRRAPLVPLLLMALAGRAHVTDLDAFEAAFASEGPERAWVDVARL